MFSERTAGGRYADIDIDREAAARFGLNIADVQEVVAAAIGGANVTDTVEALERYPVNLRYPRDSVADIRQLPIVTPTGAHVPLGAVAKVEVLDGPPMLKSENARLNGWTYIDIKDEDLGSYVAEARQMVAAQVELPPRYSVTWSGQFEYMERAMERMQLVVPITLVIIFLLLYLLDYNLSIAVGVGFIALAGVAVETRVVMLIYLDQALRVAGKRPTLKAGRSPCRS